MTLSYKLCLLDNGYKYIIEINRRNNIKCELDLKLNRKNKITELVSRPSKLIRIVCKLVQVS